MVIIGMLSAGSQSSFAGIEWTEKKQLKLEAVPIDMVTSPDGKWIFVLSKGELLVYSLDDRKIYPLPIDKSFDKLAYSAADDSIILYSTSGKIVKYLQMDIIHDFSFGGLPFKGPENAAVTLVVFSDYQ